MLLPANALCTGPLSMMSSAIKDLSETLLTQLVLGGMTV